MRIYEDANFRLVVTDSNLGLAAVPYAAGVLLLVVALLGSDARARYGLSVSGCFLLLCAVMLLRNTRFVFDDRAQRTLTWKQQSVLSRSSGQIPFDDIRGVVVEATGLEGGTDGYRLLLTTASGEIPFSDAYTPNLALYESMRDRIVAFLGTLETEPKARVNRLHGLVAAQERVVPGEEFEAVE